MMEDPTVVVLVSPELLKDLGEWSGPVQVKIEKVGENYEMIARTPVPDMSASLPAEANKLPYGQS